MDRRRPFQFTLRDLLFAMAYFSIAFAILGLIVRLWDLYLLGGAPWFGIIVPLSPAAVGIICGAGVGALYKDVRWGAFRGLLAAMLFYFFSPALVFWIAIVMVWFGIFPGID